MLVSVNYNNPGNTYFFMRNLLIVFCFRINCTISLFRYTNKAPPNPLAILQRRVTSMLMNKWFITQFITWCCLCSHQISAGYKVSKTNAHQQLAGDTDSCFRWLLIYTVSNKTKDKINILQETEEESNGYAVNHDFLFQCKQSFALFYNKNISKYP